MIRYNFLNIFEKRALGCALFLLFITSISYAQCDSIASAVVFEYGGKTYKIVKEKHSWSDAAECAVSSGGYLAEINSKQEQDTIYSVLMNHSGIALNYTAIPDGGGIAYVWIGASDDSMEGRWLWDGNNDSIGNLFWLGKNTSGSAVDGAYNNWGGTSAGSLKEPDNWNKQNAGAIALSGWPAGTTNFGIAGEWNDIGRENGLYYIIEYDHTVGVFENIPNVDFRLYPNPSSGLFVVELKEGQTANSISIKTVLGSEVYRKSLKKSNRIELNVKLNPGIYIIEVMNGMEPISTQKIRMN